MDNIKYKKKYHKYKNKYYKLIQKQPLKGGSQSMSVIAVVLTFAALLSLGTGVYMNYQTIKDFFDKNFEIIKKRVENLLRSQEIDEKQAAEENEKNEESLAQNTKPNKVEEQEKKEKERETLYKEAVKQAKERAEQEAEQAKQKAKQPFLLLKKEYMTENGQTNIKEELEFIFDKFTQFENKDIDKEEIDEIKKNCLDGVKNIKLKPDKITGKNELHWTFITGHYYVSKDNIKDDTILIKYYPEFGDHTDISVYELKKTETETSFELQINNPIFFGDYKLEYTPPEDTSAPLGAKDSAPTPTPVSGDSAAPKTSPPAAEESAKEAELAEAIALLENVKIQTKPTEILIETIESTEAMQAAKDAQAEAVKAVEEIEAKKNVTLEEKIRLVKAATEKILQAGVIRAQAVEAENIGTLTGEPPAVPASTGEPTAPAEAQKAPPPPTQSTIKLPDFLDTDEKKGILSDLDIYPTLGQSFGYYVYNNNLIPIKFLGNYVKGNEKTDLEIFTPANENALVLYSANDTNYGEYEKKIKGKNRWDNGGGGQAKVNKKGNENTYGIYAGNLDYNDTKIDVMQAYDLIANSINDAMEYFLKSEKYHYIVHPGEVGSTGYYTGNWQGRLKIEQALPPFKNSITDNKIRINEPRFLKDHDEQHDNIFIEKLPHMIEDVNSCKIATDALDAMIQTYFTEMEVIDGHSKKEEIVTQEEQEELNEFKINLKNILNESNIEKSIKNIKSKIMPGEGQCQQDADQGLIKTLEYLNMEDKFKIKETTVRKCMKQGVNQTVERHFTPLNNYIVVHNVIFIKKMGEESGEKMDMTDKTGIIRKEIKHNNGSEYELIGLIYHAGSLEAGHYIGYIKRNNMWWYCNNETIQETTLSEKTTDEDWKKFVTEENENYRGVDPVPYLMFYKKVNDEKETTYQPVGLPPIDNNCWLNALLQNLFNIDEIRNYILSV